VARVDRRHAGRQQRQKSWLRPFEHEDRLVWICGDHLHQIVVPGSPGIDAQFLTHFALQQIPGAFYVGRGEGFAVMPLHALVQLERQLCAILAPGPFVG